MTTVAWANYLPVHNNIANKNCSERISDFLDSGNGIFRFLQLVDKTAKLSAQVLRSFGYATAYYFSRMSKTFANGWQMMVFPRLYKLTTDAEKAVEKFKKDGSYRNGLKATSAVADAAAGYGYATAIIAEVLEKPKAALSVINTADTIDLAGRFANLIQTAEEFKLAGEAAETVKLVGSSSGAYNNFVETRRYNLIKLINNSAGIFSSVVGLASLSLGGPAITAITLTTIGLARTITAIGNQFYKETREHKIANMHSARFALLQPAL